MTCDRITKMCFLNIFLELVYWISGKNIEKYDFFAFPAIFGTKFGKDQKLTTFFRNNAPELLTVFVDVLFQISAKLDSKCKSSWKIRKISTKPN